LADFAKEIAMEKAERLPDGSFILERDDGYAMVMNRNHFLTGLLEDDKLTTPKAFTARKAALADLRRRARVGKIIGWEAKRD
jgi:hypothetical protein